jgi:L-histidine N-alpha-methyltransferase
MQTTEYTNPGELLDGLAAALDRPHTTVLRSSREVDPIMDFARSVDAGLGGRPRRLDCRFLYDAAGSRLYEQITALPEYYPARTETDILIANAEHIRRLTGPANLVEFGSGYSVKTAHLLAAYSGDAEQLVYVPIDVSVSALRAAGREIVEQHRDVNVVAVNATYPEAFGLLPRTTPVLALFLGGSVGNLDRGQAEEFWLGVADNLQPGDHFLLGIDLDKPAHIIEPAYDDAAGVTRAFTRNLFRRMNRELDAGLDLDAVEHESFYNRRRRQVEIYARIEREQRIRIGPLGREHRLAAGERIQTEVSRKFRLADLLPWLDGFGLERRAVFTDPRDWFALVLLRRRDGDGRSRN